MPTYVSPEELKQMAGRELEPSSWFRIDQERIQKFADATEDHQFIHVDPERAAATPFGTTIAHGFLTLSMISRLSSENAVLPEGLKMVVNYGMNKVRFLAPVPVDSDIRLRMKVLEVRQKGDSRFLVTSEATMEIRGEERPALIAHSLALYVI